MSTRNTKTICPYYQRSEKGYCKHWTGQYLKYKRSCVNDCKVEEDE